MKKSASIIGYIRNTELLIEAMKSEEKRISDTRKMGEAKLDKFKQYVKENMEKLGLDKIPTELGILSIAKNPMSVEVEDENEIPKEFKNEKITISIDKIAIKNHFKETGEIVPGTRIIDDKTNYEEITEEEYNLALKECEEKRAKEEETRENL